MRDDEISFSELRAICKKQSKILYKKYLTDVQNSIKSNVKNYWSYINKLRSDHNIPSNMYLDNVFSSNDNETANLFGSFFASVHTNSTIDLIIASPEQLSVD